MADNSRFRCLGSWTGPEPKLEAVHLSFPDEKYPKGEQLDYKGNKVDKEGTEDDKWNLRVLNLREAAEAHRRVRRNIQSYIKPGMELIDIAQKLEELSHTFIGKDGLKRGRGFPTGLSLNNCAAHDTPNPVEAKRKVLGEKDILKVDYGVHVNGNIIDCAWTVAFDEEYDPLIKATQDATNLGLKMAGPDMSFSEIASAMGEVISSYEMEKNGKTYKVMPVRNLNGHTMEPYVIHAGKSLPFHKTGDRTRMKEREVYAIETFAVANGKSRSDRACEPHV